MDENTELFRDYTAESALFVRWGWSPFWGFCCLLRAHRQPDNLQIVRFTDYQTRSN
ncbi:hypothetical protein ACLK19_04350 [Escherichia coli]